MHIQNSIMAEVLADIRSAQSLVTSSRVTGQRAIRPSLDVEEARQLAGELKAPAMYFVALSEDDSDDLPKNRRSTNLRFPKRRFDRQGREILK